MKTENLKLEIIEWVAKLGNKNTLASLINLKKAAEEDWFEQLTEKQKKNLKEGISDHKEGRTLTSKEFWANYGR